jgi:hypothetical protein
MSIHPPKSADERQMDASHRNNYKKFIIIRDSSGVMVFFAFLVMHEYEPI